MGGGAERPLTPPWGLPIRLASLLAVASYVRVAYRVRRWGRLPFRRGATLIVANHQHDLDDLAVFDALSLAGPLRDPIFSLSSRRQFEPGFLAVRLPWLRWLLYRYNPAALFSVLGMRPIENELFARPLANIAWAVHARHGDLPLSAVLGEATLKRLAVAADARTSDVFLRRSWSWFVGRAKMSELREPYRSQLLTDLRAQVDEDLGRVEDLLRRGATLYLAPEGQHSRDGSLGRFRAAFRRFAPLARVYLAAISYDPLIGRRLSMLYRVLPLDDASIAEDALRAARPVTVSQLLADWLVGAGGAFSAESAARAVRERLDTLPARLFVDPILRSTPDRMVRGALASMVRLGLLQKGETGYLLCERRRHPTFPEVDDIVAYQARFFAETLGAQRRLNADMRPEERLA